MIPGSQLFNLEAKTLSIIIVLLSLICLQVQGQDGKATNYDQRLLSKLDSLQNALDSLRVVVEKADTESPDSSADRALADAAENIIGGLADQRSRRIRLDALLEEYMQRPGVINFNGSASAILQGSFAERQDIATATGSFDLFLATRLGGQALFFVDLEAIGGDGPDENHDTFTTLNGDAGSTQTGDGLDRLHVLEAWMEFSAFGGATKATVGKIDLTNYFDLNAVANDETTQFYSGLFVNSAALPVPGNTPGFRLLAEWNNRLFFQVAAASGDNSGNRIFDRLFKIASAWLSIAPGSDFNGAYRVYGYLDGDFDDAAGYGVSIDQAVGEDITLFGRWNRNDNRTSRFFGIKSAWSAGGQLEILFLKRVCVIGAAFGVTQPDKNQLLNERVWEAYVHHHISDWTQISPHLQFVENAAGSGDNLLIFGLRTQFDF